MTIEQFKTLKAGDKVSKKGSKVVRTIHEQKRRGFQGVEYSTLEAWNDNKHQDASTVTEANCETFNLL